MNNRMDSVDTGYEMSQRMEEMNQMMNAMRSGNQSQMLQAFHNSDLGMNQSYVAQVSADMGGYV